MHAFPEVGDNGDEDGRNATLDDPISPDGRPEPGQLYSVPARQGRAVRLHKGERLKIVNTHGTQVCDTWAFSAEDPAEFLSMEHLRAWIGRLVPRPGDELATNRRRPILVLEEDSSPGVHDTLIAACDLWRYRTLGVEGYHDNCADNLRMATKAIGLRVREVPSPLKSLDEHPDPGRGRRRFLSHGQQARRPCGAACRDGLRPCDVRLSAGHSSDQRTGLHAGRGAFRTGLRARVLPLSFSGMGKDSHRTVGQ